MSDIDTVREALERAHRNAQTSSQLATVERGLTALQSIEEENKRLRGAVTDAAAMVNGDTFMSRQRFMEKHAATIAGENR